MSMFSVSWISSADRPPAQIVVENASDRYVYVRSDIVDERVMNAIRDARDLAKERARG